MNWLVACSTAVQAIAAVVLTVTTIFYAIEAQRARKASEESLGLLRRQVEAQLGFSVTRVRGALINTYGLISYWKEQYKAGLRYPERIPNAEALDALELRETIAHVRIVYPDLGNLLLSITAQLRSAKSEFDKMRLSPVGSKSGKPLEYLDSAAWVIDRVLKDLPGEHGDE